MNDVLLYQRLGELVGELKGTNQRLSDIVSKMDNYEGRLKSLEESRALARGGYAGIKWLATLAFTLATLLGLERAARLFGLHV